MDPIKSNGEWSASEIHIVKSLIARYDGNNSYVGDMNKKHNDIVNEIQAMFPWKAKHEVIRLYVDLVVEMIQSGTGNNTYHFVEASGDNMNNNYEIPPGNDPAMNNMKVAQDVPCGQPTPRMKRPLTEFWSMEEHRLFLLDTIHSSYMQKLWSFYLIFALFLELFSTRFMWIIITLIRNEVARDGVDNNFEIPVKDPAMDNMRLAHDVPRSPPAPQKKLTGFWNKEEHRLFLLDIFHSCIPLTCTSYDLFFCIVFGKDWHTIHVNYYYTH